MIELFLLVAGLLVVTAALAFLLGFRVGGEHWQTQLNRVRAESNRAASEMHSLTRAAFEAMADHADWRRQAGK
jgi:hypothetical protein